MGHVEPVRGDILPVRGGWGCPGRLLGPWAGGLSAVRKAGERKGSERGLDIWLYRARGGLGGCPAASIKRNVKPGGGRKGPTAI